ncbi:hypothetical protein PAPYR_6513 [Paratrimastix pyriformis]|uniref:Uncharacterized protein n=1 Tax=Paratrimastix pyriformis TaxID=342808 RepID=A0ABQ8UEY6_9EUKA|nr:hypothetical protein PAPYR_6513 [Paratrimastix pyriformis]
MTPFTYDAGCMRTPPNTCLTLPYMLPLRTSPWQVPLPSAPASSATATAGVTPPHPEEPQPGPFLDTVVGRRCWDMEDDVSLNLKSLRILGKDPRWAWHTVGQSRSPLTSHALIVVVSGGRGRLIPVLVGVMLA